ncbi:thyroglobulin type-1 repeat-containing domain protein, partial [Ostertagia ostertagi]
YYETVQCDARGCFCVAANNGLVAFDTRTANNMTLPKCSKCHNALRDLYMVGMCLLELRAKMRCDYEELQCDARQEFCYCVDTKTGKEIANTRKRKEGNKYITCGKNNISTTFSQLPITEGSPLFQERYPVARETCKLDRSKGWACQDQKPSV